MTGQMDSMIIKDINKAANKILNDISEKVFNIVTDFFEIDKSYYDSNGYPDYYIGDGDNQWELIDKVDMKFNRMIFYPENIFHSALLEKGDFTENYRKTQLVFS